MFNLNSDFVRRSNIEVGVRGWDESGRSAFWAAAESAR